MFNKIVLNFSLFLFSVVLVHSYVAIERRNPNAEPNTCISNTYNIEMKAGETKHLTGICLKAMCQSNGNIIYYGCGAVMLPPNCVFIEPDVNLPYPDCCKKDFICDDNEV